MVSGKHRRLKLQTNSLPSRHQLFPRAATAIHLAPVPGPGDAEKPGRAREIPVPTKTDRPRGEQKDPISYPSRIRQGCLAETGKRFRPGCGTPRAPLARG